MIQTQTKVLLTPQQGMMIIDLIMLISRPGLELPKRLVGFVFFNEVFWLK